MGPRENKGFSEVEDLKLLVPEQCGEIEADPEAKAGEQIAYPDAGAWDAGQPATHGNASRRASRASMVSPRRKCPLGVMRNAGSRRRC